ncbi:MAG: ABC transporter ATP-binding protein [Deltaproteobacteria bacterium]|nr:ABC transporter ATP-binding protein [Deltaproteobacteria bacterium]MBW1960269.1 ABC transporter ATP-binding protein [Deltaproteobacteria bacterium]MBW1993679.1 ABC transporter ATP-binding protein [Deltaproteobacteria bacterium]MBW2150318.1 ABC transporter ATP-binding protein [Deltaproteobacteria bacterium]
MTSAIIEITNLSFSYNRHEVLKHVNLRVKRGEFLALIGPNGGGKTTLLKLILGLLIPDKGMVRVFGQPPLKVSYRMGYVPQDTYLNRYFPVTALEVVLMGRLKSGKGWRRPSRIDRIAAQKALEKMAMAEYGNRHIAELSGGQRQRILIARALVSEPELLLLDEPTASIDTTGQTEFYSIIENIHKTATILMVTHDLMMLSSHVDSVACVNRLVHYHDEAQITEEMLAMYECPVELIAHGLPHRVLKEH